MIGFNRRMLLTGAIAGTFTPSALAAMPLPQSRAVRAPGAPGRDYDVALAALADHVVREMAVWGLPGLTLSVTDTDGFAATMSFGWADVDKRMPVAPAQLFQIGSISKSFASICLHALADAGKIDLDAPLARYLHADFLPAEPITVSQVLSHCAGLPDAAPIAPRTPDGKLWCGFKPGSKFSYSNTGYHLLGLLIEAVGGAPHPELIERMVLKPLGMTATRPVLVDRDRADYATGYTPLVLSRAYLPGEPLAPGPWTDMDSAAGSIGSTADDMARYLRFLLALGAGKGAPILTDAMARRLTMPIIDAPDFGAKARYGNGLATVPVGGKPCLHHTGGMMLFSSSFHADPAAGVACFASTNVQLGDGYRPRLITSYAVELMRGVRAGAKLPKAPDPAERLKIDKPGRFAGRFIAADGTAIEIGADKDSLTLSSGGTSGRLLIAGKSLITDHPAFADGGFNAVREGKGDDAPITGLWWRETLFSKGAAAAPPTSSDRLHSLAGRYVSTDPWIGEGSVYARGNKLVIEGGDVLTERTDGYWATDDDPGGVERLRFEAPIGGRPSRLSFSGADQIRFAVG